VRSVNTANAGRKEKMRASKFSTCAVEISL